MKVCLSVVVREGYNEVCNNIVEVECGKIESPYGLQKVLRKALDIADDKAMFSREYDNSFDLFMKIREKQIRDEADKKARLDNAPQAKTWELESKLTQLQSALARKECQIDGIIKGLNPEYVAQPDKDEPSTL